MKKIISLLIALSFMVTTAYAENRSEIIGGADGFEMKYNTRSDEFVISGMTDKNGTVKNPFVSVLAFENGKMTALEQARINSDGSYKCNLGFPNGISDKITVKVLAADENIRVTDASFAIMCDDITDVRYEKYKKGNDTVYYADLTELYTGVHSVNIIIVEYDENGRLVECTRFDDGSIKESGGKYIFEQAVQTVGTADKMLIWSKFERMIPYAVTTEGFELDLSEIKPSLGKADDRLERLGYSSGSLDGENDYRTYKKAVSELPDEFEVVKPVPIEKSYEIFVSPNGDDRNDGTIEKPLKTIHKAISAYGARNPAYQKYRTTIYLREGVYTVNDMIEISGKKINIAAYNGEKVTVTSAKPIDGSKFKKVTSDNISAKKINSLSDSAKENLYYCTYAELGINGFPGLSNDGFKLPTMIYNGEDMMLARYPNTYNDNVEKVLDNGVDSVNNKIGEKFEIIPLDKTPLSWNDTGKICMWSQMSATWTSSMGVVTIKNGTVSGPAKIAVVQVGNTLYPVATSPTNYGIAPSQLYFFNALEAIDMEGEWCCDDEDGRVYFYPPKGMLKSGDTVSFSNDTIETILDFNNSSDIVIDGISFEQGRNTIGMKNCRNIIIQNCTFNAITSTALSLYNCYKCGVINSDFNNSNSAVSISADTVKWENLDFGRNFVQNCHSVGTAFVTINNASGNIISHNLVENTSGSALSIWHGSENIFEYNEVRSASLVGNEGGVVYINGHVDSLYNHIRYNYIHDNRPLNTYFDKGPAVLCDDMEDGVYIYGNIFQNQKIGISYNCGDNNMCENNVFINCKIGIDDISTMYGGYGTFMGMKRSNTEKLTDGRMFLYYTDNLKSSVWSKRYPRFEEYVNYTERLFADWKSDESYDNSEDMKFFRASTGNYILNNIFAGKNNDEDILFRQVYSGNKILVDNPYIAEVSPEGEVPTQNGQSYNVVYNNTQTESYDLSQNEVFAKCGFNRGEEFDSAVDIIYNVDGKLNASEYIDLYWRNVKGANYYKLTVAYDEDFNSIYSTSYTFSNYIRKKISKSCFDNIVYYYKLEAISVKNGENTVIAAATGSAAYDKYSQKQEELTLVDATKSDMNFSRYRTYVDMGSEGYIFRNLTYMDDSINYSLTDENESDGTYIYLTGSNYSKKRDSWSDYVCFGRSVENGNTEIDTDTYVEIEADFRFPSEETFPDNNYIAMSNFAVSKLAVDKETGKYSETAFVTAKKDADGMYTIYAGAMDGIISLDDHITLVPLETVTSEELFGKWHHVKISADMADGLIGYTYDNGKSTQINMNTRTDDTLYKWNTGNYLSFLDFAAFSQDSGAVSAINIKNIKAVRRVKN